MTAKISTREEGKALYDKANAAVAIVEKGRKTNSHFASGYQPIIDPPDLYPSLRIDESADALLTDREAVTEAMRGDTDFLNDTVASYNNRSAYGMEELRAKVDEWLAKQGIHYEGDAPHFVCTSSVNNDLYSKIFTELRDESCLFSKQGNTNALLLVCTPTYGLAPSRAYKHHIDIATIQTDKSTGYKLDAATLKAALIKHPDARGLSITNPCNPTSACMTEPEIEAIANVVHEHNTARVAAGKRPLIVLVDETFRNLMWEHTYDHRSGEVKEGQTFISLAANEKLKPWTLSVNSFSKDFAPGIGFAYAYGPPELIKDLSFIDGASVPAQQYATHVFDPGKPEAQEHFDNIKHIVEGFYKVLGRKLGELNTSLKQQFKCDEDLITIPVEPVAGFNVALDFSKLAGFKTKEGHALHTGKDVAEHMMKQCITYPGEMFYIPEEDMMLRVSLHQDKIHRTMECISEFCHSLTPPERGVVKDMQVVSAAETVAVTQFR